MAARLATAGGGETGAQGSSVGLQFIERVEDWNALLTEALKFDSEVLVEEKIIGRETTVGILGGEALPIVEVRPKAGLTIIRINTRRVARSIFARQILIR